MLTRTSSSARARLAVLLAVSETLRIGLAVAGGQLWWPDETRFDASLAAVQAALFGRWHEALVSLFGSADHVGFKVLGVIPALAVTAGFPLWIAAVFFGAFSVASVWLVWRIAWLASNGDESVAWWSAFFAAISVSLFYYSRHLLPYDPALAFGLAAIVMGLRDARPRAGFWAGLCGGVGFLTYNGYWLFCGAALLVAVVGLTPTFRRVAARSLLGIVGLVTPIAVALLLGFAVGADLWHGAVSFSHTVSVGDFHGWSFVGEYFWASEGWLVVIWALALVLGLADSRRRRYVLLWAGALVFLYAGLGVLSAVAHRFVVHGRIVRCCVPFFALICGAAMTRVGERIGRRVQVGVALVLAIAAAARFAVPLRQSFPNDFATRGRALIAGRQSDERVRIVNAYSLYVPVYVDATAAGETLFARPHPLQYQPFLFENLDARQRTEFRDHDLTMRVVRLRVDAPGAVPFAPPGLDRYPGPLRLTVRLPVAGEAYSPLLVTGSSARAGDFLSVLRVGPNQYRFSLVHWYAPECLSAELTLDEHRDHTIDVALGSLLPPSAGIGATGLDWAALRRWAYVAVDGRPVFDRPAEFHPATPGQIDIGCNYIGGVATDARFRGQILSVAAIAPEAIVRAAREALAAPPRL